MSARRRFAFLVLVTIAALLAAGTGTALLCQKALASPSAELMHNVPGRALQRVALQLKWHHQFQFSGYYAAIEQGYFRNAGLEVILKEATPQLDPTSVVATGHAEYGISGSNLLIQRVQGQPLVAIGAIFQHAPTMLMVRSDSGIHTPQDLRGKRVMIETAVDPEITAMLRNEGLNDRNIQRLPHSWNIEDLIEGRADAISCYSTNEPFLMKQRRIDVNLIHPLKYGIDFYGDCLFTNQKEATEHPERVAAFMDASRRGWIYAMSHRTEMANLILGRYSTRSTREHLLFEAAAMELLILPDLVEVGHMNPWRWRQIGDQYAKLGLLGPDYSMDGFLFTPPQPWSHRYLLPLVYIAAGLISAGLLVVLALMLFNGRLRRAVKNQTTRVRESEHRLRRAVVDAPFPIMIHAEDGRILMVSNVWYEITGYRSEEIATIADWAHRAHGQDADAVRADIDRLYSATGRVVCGEYEVNTAGGDKRVWDFSAAPLGKDADAKRCVISMAMDVTARKRAEQAASELSRKYQLLFNSGNDAVLVCRPDEDGKPGRFIDVNDVACQQFGYDREEFLQMTPLDIDACDDPAAFAVWAKELAEKGQILWESTGLRKDGRRIPIELNTSLFDLGGRPAMISILRDMTLRKRTEAALAAAKTAAEEASRAKDRLMATVSHELRTPLMPILMRLSMLQEDPQVPASLQKSITMMRQGIELETRLIDGLLDLTRLARGKLQLKPEFVDAHELLERALAMSAEEDDAMGPAIRRDLKATQHMVHVDPLRMQQVCWNIIKNAMHYTPLGGTLTLESDNTAEGMLELRFIDTGIGIDSEFLPRIFDAFERGPNMADVRPGGLGLGMAIAKTLMQQLGGSIAVASEGRGKGSTFTVRLPLASTTAGGEGAGSDGGDGEGAGGQPARPASPLPDVPAPAPAAPAPLRILWVEDDPTTRKVLAHLLRTMGHNVQPTSTVQEAIAAAESQAFDLLLSDIGLPDGSGIDVMRWFSQHRPIPGIAISGFGQDEDMQRSLVAGFAMHLVKPVPVSTLRRAIQEATAPSLCP